MDGIFSAETFTVPRWHDWIYVRPKPGLVVGLNHIGTNAGIFAMQDYDDSNDLHVHVYIPRNCDGMKGWEGRWWDIESIVKFFPDSEISRHFGDILDASHHVNYRWIYPNLDPFIDEEWFKEMLDDTPDLKEDTYAAYH